jgi:hypothetical protein
MADDFVDAEVLAARRRENYQKFMEGRLPHQWKPGQCGKSAASMMVRNHLAMICAH